MSVLTGIRTLWRFLLSRDAVALRRGRRLRVDTASLRDIDPGYGDFLIHPCVRYIPEGFAGHHWWMAVTPFPRVDDRYENPVLYYGEGEGNEPPRSWHFVGVVQPSYEKGYNADCNLFFDGQLLWILWKETGTPHTTPESGFDCVMGRSFDGHSWGPVKKFLDNPDTSANRMTAPAVVGGESVKCLATCYEKRVDNYDQPHGKSGLSVWMLAGKGLADGHFVWQRDVPQHYPDWFDLWHTDYFSYKGVHYCVATTERATLMLLGRSEDGESYTFSPLPLLSKTGNLYVGMYKASAVVNDGIFYLFFPGKSLSGRKSRIYCASMQMDELVRRLWPEQ